MNRVGKCTQVVRGYVVVVVHLYTKHLEADGELPS